MKPTNVHQENNHQTSCLMCALAVKLCFLAGAHLPIDIDVDVSRGLDKLLREGVALLPQRDLRSVN